MNDMQGHDGSSGGEPTFRKLQLHLSQSFVSIVSHNYRGYTGTHPSLKATPSKSYSALLRTQHSEADVSCV